MKTLTIALSLLLVVLPAGAQPIISAPAPSFYVPYGVRDVPMHAMLPESTSAETQVADPGQQPNPPTTCQCPMHRRAHRRHGSGYGAYPPTPSMSTGAMVTGLVAVGLALLVIAAVHD